MSQADEHQKLRDYLTRATSALKQTKRQLAELEAMQHEPIAVLGIGCRYPGGIATPEQLWQVVDEGRDVVSGFPTDRGWDADLLDPDPDRPGKSITREGGFLHDAARFDPGMFEISPREALTIDPQQRLLLETSWEALERAQIRPDSLRGSDTGVFVGIMYHDYGARQLADPTALSGNTWIGSTGSVASGRIAYTLGLEGPTVTVDTACSSSLVTLHLACSALRRGECSLALAGGAAVMSTPMIFIEFSRQRALARDGRCKPFSAAADGVGWGEGVGMLVLERLSDARRHGHPVLAVIRGSAINQDGRSQGLTAPNGPSQQRVIRAALADAGLEAGDVELIEAHGTGTPLGDPIEAIALQAVYGRAHTAGAPAWLGSLKSNIAHTQAAAGVGGVIKVMLAMRHAKMPRSLHAEHPTPQVDWSDSLRLLAQARPWAPGDRPRRGAVSSFGLSGTNAHVIVEEPPGGEPDGVSTSISPRAVPLILTARTEGSLREQAGRLQAHVEAEPELAPADLAHSLLTTRAQLERRVALTVETREQLRVGLAELARGGAPTGLRAGEPAAAAKLAFMFTGQGSQRVGMGRELYQAFAAYREAFDSICAEFRMLRPGVAEIVLAEPGSELASLLDRTAYAQPALFAVELALVRLLESFGVVPDVLIGHSIGELVAAHVAGVWSLADACRVIEVRGRLMQALPRGGAMVAIRASEEEVVAALPRHADRELGIAAINGPRSTVISGAREAVEQLAAVFEGKGREVRELRVSHAFHSPLMEPMLRRFEAFVANLPTAAPRLPIVSNLSGALATEEQLRSSEYWARHVMQPVRFHAGVESLVALGATCLLEIGPQPVLCSLAAETIGERPEPERPTLVATLRDGHGELGSLAAALGQLHCVGRPVDWSAYFGRRRVVALPTYAFERGHYWLAAPRVGRGITTPSLRAIDHPLLAGLVTLADDERVLVSGRVSVAEQPWLADHRVFDRIVVPGAVLAELARVACVGVDLAEIGELSFEAPLVVPESGAVIVQLRIGARQPDGQRSLQIHARLDDEGVEGVEGVEAERWTRHASGTIGPARSGVAASASWSRAWPPVDAVAVDLSDAHARLAARGLDYGPSFAGLAAAWRRGDERLVELRLPASCDAESFALHPALLDAALHVLALDHDDERALLPFAWTGLRFHEVGASRLRVRLARSGEGFSLDARDETGAPVVSAERVILRGASASELRAASIGGQRGALYQLDWQPLASTPTAGSSAQSWRELEVARGDALTSTVWLLAKIREWLADERLASTGLVVITRRAVATRVGETIEDLGAAACWGLARVARSEHPDRRLVLVDLDEHPDSRARLTAALAGDEPELALRGGEILIPRLVPCPSATPRRLEIGEGTVLVTGATGALGSSVVRHLVEVHGARRLLLASRRGPEAPGADELVAALTAAGAEVSLRACDVADRERLAELLATIPASHPLRAVIHIAGIVDDGVLESLTEARIARVFRPKVDAALCLHEATREHELAAFVLFSSISGVTGTAGQGSYAAANALLDALAAARRAEGRVATSLAWGPWAGAGMATELGATDRARLRRRGLIELEPDDGLALFDAALALDRADLVAAAIDTRAIDLADDTLAPVMRRLARPRVGPAIGVTAAEPSAAPLLAELAAVDDERRRALILELVRTEATATLGLAAAPASGRALRELGLDSLTAIELRNRLQKQTGLRLAATLLFDHPSIGALVDHLLAELAPAQPSEPPPAAGSSAAAIDDDDPIAIVAAACRYPGGVESPEQLWALLAEGRDAIAGFPTDRGWALDALFDDDPDTPGTSVARAGGFLYDAAAFDPAAFGISPREAKTIDPQQRLLLEVSWEALERARIPAERVVGSSTGVFVGIMYGDYGSRLYATPEALEGHVAIGSAASVASGRIAYTLGLEGPAVTVDTACSSSLVAVHMAVQALRRGECELALAGGATVMATPTVFIEFSRQRGLARDGRCKSFTDAADGVGWSEGAGMLVLERLSDARRQGHPVLALIRGSAINQDGRSQGLTAPNGPAQQRVIRAALADAKLDADAIDLVEGHGTGTQLGDPIEIQALQATYGRGRAPERPLWLGSIKSNIGHTQAAAGVAGIIKAVLALERGQLPPTRDGEQPSRRVEWDGVALIDRLRPWPGEDRPRRAAVSSFGISGTNAHVILEQAPTIATDIHAPQAEPAPRPIPLLLSAQTSVSLAAAAARLRDRLLDDAELALVDLGYSLATTRSVLEHRAVVVAASRADARAGLDALAEGRGHSTLYRPERGRSEQLRLALLFTGQGAQRVGMGRELHAAYPRFAESFDRTCARFDGLLERPLAEVVFGEPELLERTIYTQPALFAVELALHDLLASFGVRPTAVLGHSIGELVAARVAGIWSLDDACKLVAARGRLIDALPEGGAMAAVEADEDELAPLLDGRAVDIAGINGPRATVISGDAEDVAAVVAELDARGRRTRRLAVSHAFHSRRMEPMLAAFAEVAGSLEYHPPSIPIVSNFGGPPITEQQLCTPDYWVRHVREPVRFVAGVRELERRGIEVALEVGPHGVLTALAAGCLTQTGAEAMTLLPIMHERRGEREQLGLALGGLHCLGAAIDWQAWFAADSDARRPRQVALPTYAFVRQRYWLDAPRPPTATGRLTTRHPMLSPAVTLADGGRVFTARVSLEDHPWLADHVVAERILLPGAAILELALAAGLEVGVGEVEQLSLLTPVVLERGGVVELQLALARPDALGRRELALHGRSGELGVEPAWTLHATGQLGVGERSSLAVGPVGRVELPADAVPIDPVELYADLDARGLHPGPSFRKVARGWRTGEAYVVELRTDDAIGSRPGHVIDPALLDAALQLLVGEHPSGTLALPFEWSRVRVLAAGGRPARARISPEHADDGDSRRHRIELDDELGRTLLQASIVTRPVALERLRTQLDARPVESMFRIAWRPVDARAADRPLSLATRPTLDAVLAENDSADALAVLWCREPAGDPLAASLAVLAQLQRWLAADRLADARLVVVTRRAIATGDEDVLDLDHAPIWGMVRAVQAEHPERAINLVDLDEQADALPSAALLDHEPQLAVRAAVALVPRLVRAPAIGGEPSRFDPDATVLVTGATGGLGVTITRHLVAAHGVRKLLLCSRRGPDAPGAEALRAELEAAGATVTIAAVDVGDRAALAELLASTPRLGAVIHAAGVIEDGMFATLDADRLARVFRAKVDAARHLDALTRELALDQFVLFSSVAGILGSAGQANYAAANTYLDALAAHRRARGQRGVGLAWGPWAGAGMAAELSAANRERMARHGLCELEPSEALACFDAGLGQLDTDLVPARFDLARLAERAELPRMFTELVHRAAASRGPAGDAEGLVARLAAASERERDGLLLELVRREIALVLGLADPSAVEPRRALAELGLDSLMAVELRNRLQSATGLRLGATLSFDYPSAEALVGKLRDELAGAPARRAAPTQTDARREASSDAIAIVGIGCRYPGGVRTPEQLWSLLERGVDASSSFPSDRGWPLDLHDPDPDAAGKSITDRGGFLHDAAEFDPGVFGISPREAAFIDPQQRLLLETAWEALERAGIPPLGLEGSSTGVFVGIMYADYGGRFVTAPEALAGQVGLGSAPSVASGRLAYTLGLEGPALTIDTACSSSLVALHLGARSLRERECDLALVGGVTVMATPNAFIEFSRQRGLAVDGRCKSFSAAADGVAWAEGAAVLVLERLSDARRRGHPVLAIVRGSAVNQDGRSQGLTAPNGPAQQRVIRAALAAAGLAPEQIDAVEAHGTGTRLGDPIEAQALLDSYGVGRPADRPLWLGSIKSNLGHTQAAAGAAGVIKMVLALAHRRLPPTLHVETPSEHVDWSGGALALLRDGVEWPRGAEPRRAAVSSFGISGTNAHVILEEPPPEPRSEPVRAAPGRSVCVVMSAADREALDRQIAALRRHCLASDPPDLVDLGRSLATTRAHLRERLGFVIDSREALLTTLEQLDSGRAPTIEVVRRRAPSEAKLCALFSGQGAQRLAMGRELHASAPVFRYKFDELCAAFDRELEHPLAQVMFATPGSELASLLDQTAYTQPALFAFEVALFELLGSRGVHPTVLLGHSIGELAAAHVAGVLTIADACKLVAARGRLMQALPEGGAMISIRASAEEVLEQIAVVGGCDLAGVNGPLSTVVSGELAAVTAVAEHFAGLGRETRRLSVSHAFHSRRLDPMLAELRAVAASVELRPPRLAIVANLDGQLASAEQLCSPDYWVRQAREPVQLLAGVRSLEALGVNACVELGPGSSLTAMVRGCLSDAALERTAMVATVRGGRAELASFDHALVELHCAGVSVDWQAHFAGSGARRVPLPTYAFARRRYWLDGPASATSGELAALGLDRAAHPWLGAVMTLAERDEQVSSGRLSVAEHGWLGQHEVFGRTLVPGTAMLELALAAAEQLGAASVERLELDAPLLLDAELPTLVQVTVAAADGHRRRLSIHARVGDQPWRLHASGLLATTAEPEVIEPLSVWPPEGATELALDSIHARLAAAGLVYGPAFGALARAWALGERRYVELHRPPELATDERYRVHPAMFDAALHLLAVEGLDHVEAASVPLPVAWSEVRVHGIDRGGDLRVELSPVASADGRESTHAITVADADGRVLVRIGGLHSRPVSRATIERSLTGRARPSYALRWDLVESAPTRAGSELARVIGGPEHDALAEALGCARVERLADAGDGLELLIVAHTGPTTALAGTLELTSLLRAWLAEPRFEHTRLVVLTRHAIAVGEGERVLELDRAPAWGLVRSVRREHPRRSLSVLDIDDHPASLAALAGTLDDAEPELAVREGRVAAPRIDRRIGDAADRVRFDPDRTVLITGATGALGAAVARHLVEAHGVRHLLLCSRRGPAAPRAAALRATLEAAGASVELVACELDDQAAVAHLIASVPAAHPLGAVVHAAGELADGTLDSLDDADFARVFAAKLDGARHLDHQTASLQLDHFVLFSSLAGTLGAAGQANYAAANAYLDALAADRRARGLAGLAIAWGPWAGEGMADDQSARARMARLGVLALHTDEALGLFDDALAQPSGQPIAARFDLQTLARLEERPAIFATLIRTPAQPSATRQPPRLGERLTAVEPSRRASVVAGVIRDEAVRALGLDDPEQLRADEPLQSLGLDSLSALELRDRLQTITGLRLASTLLFDHPSVDALTAHVLERLAVPASASLGSATDESELRRRIAAIPIERLRSAGLLDALLQLDQPQAPATSGDPPKLDDPDDAAIDAMSIDDLVALLSAGSVTQPE